MLAPEVPGSPFPAYWLSLQGWLNDRGLWFLEMQLRENIPWMPLPFESLCIFFGETKKGVKHAIIGRCANDSFEGIFNPWPEAEFGDGIAALGFILPRDPANYMKLGIGLARVEKLSKEWAGVMAGPPAVGAKEIRLGAIHAAAQEALGTEEQPTLFGPNGQRV